MLVACSGSPEPDPPKEEVDTDSTPVETPVETPVPTPEPTPEPFPAARLAAAIVDWSDAVRDASFEPPADIADQMLSYMEPGCPVWETTEPGDRWTQTPCTTSLGVEFTGDYLEVDNLEPRLITLLDQDWILDAIQQDVPAWSITEGLELGPSRMFDSESRVTLPFGRQMVLSGEYRGITATWPEVTLQLITLGGPWWDPIDDERALPALTAMRVTTDAGRLILVDGEIERPNPTVDVVIGEQVRLADHLCRSEPTGVFRIRDLDQTWYDVTFDGVCDGCGLATVDGELAGDICL